MMKSSNYKKLKKLLRAIRELFWHIRSQREIEEDEAEDEWLRKQEQEQEDKGYERTTKEENSEVV